MCVMVSLLTDVGGWMLLGAVFEKQAIKGMGCK